jgi:hypothetical protein
MENSSLRKLALHKVGSYPPLYGIMLSMVFKNSFFDDSLIGFKKEKGQRERVTHPSYIWFATLMTSLSLVQVRVNWKESNPS